MPARRPRPGISQRQRDTEARLQRLEAQLGGGVAVSDPVLAQWIRRYGEPARALVRAHGRYHHGLETGASPTDA